MKFATVINCMDGRTQEQTIAFLKNHFNADFIDTVTEPGPVKILAEQSPEHLLQSIFDRVDISINAHGSKAIAVLAHAGCAGNPASKEEQLEQLDKAEALLEARYPGIDTRKIWVDENLELEDLG